MRRAYPAYEAPAGLRAAAAAAIDDDALAPLAQLEGQGAGMRVLVKAARRRLAGIDQNEALPRLQALKAHLRRIRRGAALRLRPGQHQVDEHRVFLDRVVE